MSTQLTEHSDHWVVSTIASPGKRRHIPRGAVRVDKGDPEKLARVMLEMATQARIDAGVPLPPPEPIE